MEKRRTSLILGGLIVALLVSQFLLVRIADTYGAMAGYLMLPIAILGILTVNRSKDLMRLRILLVIALIDLLLPELRYRLFHPHPLAILVWIVSYSIGLVEGSWFMEHDNVRVR